MVKNSITFYNNLTFRNLFLKMGNKIYFREIKDL
jgi:hypothetical protein